MPFLSEPDGREGQRHQTEHKTNHQINGNGDTNAAHSDEPMPIAIVGLSCRFPGDATDPEQLWNMISKGRSAWSEVPPDRFNVDAFHHPSGDRQGTMNVRGGHFLKNDVAAFDAPFFTITPNEAKAMDPQQRIMLELVYESLENAGISMHDVVRSDTSCFVGCSNKDYDILGGKDGEDLAKYHVTGTSDATLSNRLSWFYDLHGPNLCLDTACSSSIVALHLACQSLRTGESKMSICGAVNLILNPEGLIVMTRLGFLGEKCRTFDHKASGYSRGEGAASLVLKPLDDAIRDNDVIRAVIRGTAVNQDGKTPGLTLPSAEMQEQLIKSAYRNAGLDFQDTGYFEAHGTGTPAGDPLETRAIGSMVGRKRSPADPLIVGSVKSNIGHIEGAAGLAGLIKAVYVLEKGLIPPVMWFEKINPRILLDEWNLKIPTEMTPWPTQGLRRVSVNSFGIGGTNAHAIVDDAYHYLLSRGLNGRHNTTAVPQPDSNGTNSNHESSTNGHTSTNETQTPHLLMWSSHDQAGISRLQQLYLDYLRQKEEKDTPEMMARLSYTLNERRTMFPWRTFCVASTIHEVEKSLENGLSKPVRSSQPPRVGFVFTGQGAQWHAMGRELLVYEVYYGCIKAADTFFRTLGCTWSLIDELQQSEKESKINRTAYSQPICTAVQVALVDLLKLWNVKPVAVVGHSSGEIAAAYCAGFISQESAWTIAFQRGRHSDTIQKTSPKLEGAMLAAGNGEDEIQEYLSRVRAGRVSVACINSPSSVTVSGDAAGIDELYDMLTSDRMFARRLKVDVAYHSHHMQSIAKDYLQSLQHIQTTRPTSTDNVRMFSSLTGRLVESTELGPQYWVDNMTCQVKFSQATRSLLGFSTSKRQRRGTGKPFADFFIEIGPHAALKGPLKQILNTDDGKAASMTYCSVLERGSNAATTALTVAGQLFAQGHAVNIARASNPQQSISKPLAHLVDIPPFPWNHSYRYWHEGRMSTDYRFRKQPRHDLLGAPTCDHNPLEPRWRNFLRVNENPWIQDHRVQSNILYPAAGMCVMAIEAAKQCADTAREIKAFELRDIRIGSAIIVPQDEPGVETMLHFRPWKLGSQAPTSVWHEFIIYSKVEKEDWQENCSGLIVTVYKPDVPAVLNDNLEEILERERSRNLFAEAEKKYLKEESPRKIYAAIDAVGTRYGPLFQNLTSTRLGHNAAVCTIKIPDTKGIMPSNYEYPHTIHPTVLDTVVQMWMPSYMSAHGIPEVPFVPQFLEKMYISADMAALAPGEKLRGHVSTSVQGYRQLTANMAMSDPTWDHPLITVEGLRFKTLAASTSGSVMADAQTDMRKLCSYPVWKEDVDFLSRAQARDLFSTFAKELPHPGSHVIEEHEMACFTLIKRVLAQFTPQQAQSFAPHLRLFYGYMQNRYQLGLQGKLEHQSSSIDWLDLSVSEENSLLERVSQSTADGNILCHIGQHLPAVLEGKAEPLEILLQENRLGDWYAKGLGLPEAYAQISQYMDRTLHKRPGINVLEIGAGTGGTTQTLFRSLTDANESQPRFGSYTFTDISTGFFESAQEKLKEWEPYMIYKKLNIEESPSAQGFEIGSFDVVIATNVLHATSTMTKTLANVHSLLKPGGKLILTEITHLPMRVSMIVGSLPGWWLGEDDGRKLGPTLCEAEWDDLLRRTGFSGIDIELHDYEDPREHAVSVMVSTVPMKAEPALVADIFIMEPMNIQEDVAALSSHLKAQLNTSGLTVAVVTIDAMADMKVQGKVLIVLVETQTPLLADLKEKDFYGFRKMTLESAGVLWVTKGGAISGAVPEMSTISGLARVIRAEAPAVQLITLDIDPSTALDSSTTAECIQAVFASTCGAQNPQNSDNEFALRDGFIFISRIHEHQAMDTMLTNLGKTPAATLLSFGSGNRALKLEVRVPGMLDTLQFVDDPRTAVPLPADDIEIQVKAIGLNFMDIMVSMGQISDSVLGLECSGIVTKVGSNVSSFKAGDRIMAFTEGSFATKLRAPAAVFQHVPEGMGFDIAASIPLIYSTAYYSLFDAARLQAGETILIHAAAGGVGQAAIILAQHLHAEIFVTVGSEDKKKLLIKAYGIREDHIFNSRNLDFAKGIMRMTDGKGVDVVLNSLAGEALRQTWNCIAMFGRFVEIGKKDIVGNTGLDMAPFMRNVSFISVNLLAIGRKSIKLTARIMEDVVALIRKGVIRAIEPVTTFPYSEVEQAFRFLQGGKSPGKVVVVPHEEDLVPMIPEKPISVKFDKNATYVLAGGLGGLGRSIGQWMANHGAVNIIFISRSGSQKTKAQETVKELSSCGVKVTVFACDICDIGALEKVFKDCANKLPPIRGIIQAAMVVDDSTFESMKYSQYVAATLPKINGTRNLHACSPSSLDFFVMLSSGVGICGSRSQANYAAGNTFQDAFAAYRSKQNLPAIVIDLGVVLGVGWAAENPEAGERFTKLGLIGIHEQEVHALLASAMTGRVGGGDETRIPAQIMTGLGTGASADDDDGEKRFWMRDARFSHLRLIDRQAAKPSEGGSNDTKRLQTVLADVANLAAAADLVRDALAAKLAKSLMMPVKDLDTGKPVSTFGVDSLVAIEVRNWIFRECKADVSIFDVLSNVPLTALAGKIAAKSKLVPAAILEGEGL